MPPYHIQEALCTIPDEWRDVSINVFMVGETQAAEFTVVVTRDALGAGTDLDAFADSQLKTCATTLVDYRFVGKRARTVQGLAAREFDFLWRSEQRTIYQRQIVIGLGESRVLACTATARDMLDDARAEQFERFLASLAWRGAAGA